MSFGHSPFLPDYFLERLGLDSGIKMTPEQWLCEPAFEAYQIMDPDGWRGANAPNWDTPLTRAEFEQRLFQCTISKRGGFL